VAPVLVGTGAAAAADSANPVRALLALGVAVALQVGVNYANDYADGVRGTDANRVGPMRLVGSGAASAQEVRAAAVVALGTAVLLGLVLVALTGQWWLLGVGALAVAAAWGYTGGRRPYGYRGLGELAVFVFFGLVATIGTAYVQMLTVTLPAVLGGIAIGCLATAILVVNNLRDRPGDQSSGKATLAVRLGDLRTRQLFLLLLAGGYAAAAAVALAGSPRALLAWLSLPWALRAATPVQRGGAGSALIPALVDTARAELGLALGLAAGLVLG
jgi:1,4-dihydroxy-2-naphthoate octaprenyltransferase